VEATMKDLFDLSGKIAIVTGGNQGIGFGIARGLASAGATVVIANRRAEEGQKAAGALQREGYKAVAVPVDVSNKASVEAMVAKVLNEYSRIDILVNNAGVIIRKAAEEFTEEEYDRIMDINVKGMFFCCQAVGTEMLKRKKGKIINVSSVIAQQVQPQRSVYAISKAGVANLTRSLALEWSKSGINVNSIAPGVTVTPLNQKYFAEHPDQLQAFADATPRGRVAYPDDYAGAAIFLASEASDYVTGHILLVDGGMAIC
jgi:NAD(P)-dependent dehydrogenase (short-subunit alcohol dehydrogenase family)